MQTFLPYPDFSKSAAVLDNKRLQKQIVECKQIYLSLTEPEYGWKNHPAVRMWKGYERQLLDYMLACIFKWEERFNKNHRLLLWNILAFDRCTGLDITPPWLSLEEFHLSHRSNLLRKDYEYYRPHFGDIPNDIPYFWPTKEGY